MQLPRTAVTGRDRRIRDLLPASLFRKSRTASHVPLGCQAPGSLGPGRVRRVSHLGAPLAFCAILMRSRAASAGPTERVSLGAGGVEANGFCDFAAISGDGRFVAFLSGASNLVANDSNQMNDVFVRDRQTGVTERVNVSSSGVQANGQSADPAISADGRFVAFDSFASNLVDLDANGLQDVFVHDRLTGTTELVSLDGSVQRTKASANPAISADGRFVAFESNTGNRSDIFVRDRLNGTTTRVSVDSDGNPGSSNSRNAAISADGRFVAFQSFASLTPEDNNGHIDIYVHDRDADGNGVFDQPGGIATFLASVSSTGTLSNGDSQEPAISADGRYVAFESLASNLVAGDGNFDSDVFVHDNLTGATQLISVNALGAPGNMNSQQAWLSADGRFVTFLSAATNLVAGDSNAVIDVFFVDRDPDGNGVFDEPGKVQISRASVDSSGLQANNVSGVNGRPTLSADGRYVAFGSLASNLVANDKNASRDVFVHDTTACGDGAVTPSSGEQCDDGNLVDGDGCDSNCTPTGCGNGIVTAGETCDDGVANGTDHCCTSDCALIDFDSDGICDQRDLAELPGLVLRSAQVKDSTGDPARPDGLVQWKADLVFGGSAPYPSSAAFLTQGALTGFDAALFQTAAEPTTSDAAIDAVSFAPGECHASGPKGGPPSSIRCKRSLPAPARTTLAFTAKKNASGVHLEATLRNVDVVAPAAGPLRAVLDLDDSLALQYEAAATGCHLTGVRVHRLRCTKPSP